MPWVKLGNSRLRERNNQIIHLYNDPPGLTMADIGLQFGISRQRVGQILKRHLTTRTCDNCYHSLEFGHCSCRETTDIVKADGQCTDWLPELGGRVK